MLKTSLLFLILGTTTPFATLNVVRDEPKTIEQQIVYYAEQYGVSTTTAVAIATCESHLVQFKDGKVLRGVQNPQDVGLFQINEKYHLEDSKSAGYDIYTLEGNIRYAMKLMKEQGTRPWNWSIGCWK